MIFNRIVQDKGRDWFEKNVLGGFASKEINPDWLRKQFIKSARTHNGFSYYDWKYLCVAEDNQERTNELMYGLRMCFNQWFYNAPPPTQLSIIDPERVVFATDLSPEISNSVKTIVEK